MSASPSGGCSCGPKAPPQFPGGAGGGGQGGGGLGGGGPLTPAFDCQCVCLCVPLRTPTGDEPPPTTMDNPPDGGATLRTLRSGPGSAVAALSVGRPSTGTVLPLRGFSAKAFSLLGPPQSAPAGVRPLGPLPAYTLGGGSRGTGVRPLSQAPASAASQTSRRGSVPAPCTQTLENYSPSLKGARYPSSMGDRLQRPFAGCDTGKPAPGAPLTVSPPTAPPDAGKGTDWVFLGFGMAGGSRDRPPMAAEPDPVQPLRRRSPHGEVGPTVAVAPPHSGVKDFDFGPGGGLGSEGLDFGFDGVPDPVAAEIRDRHGAYPGLLPGDVPDPDLETRQPAGALDSRDLVSSAVRKPRRAKAIGPGFAAGAIGPGQLPGMTTALGPDSPSRDLSLLTRATQRSLGGGGGGGVVRGGRAAGLAEQAAVLLSAREEATWQLRQRGDTTAVTAVLQAHAAYESVSDAYRKLQRERNIGLSFEKAVARARERARTDEMIRRLAAERVARADWRRFDARWARFRGISGDARGYDRARAYGQAREDLDRARGDVRNQIRDARNALLDLRGKEDTEATTQRIATLEAALERARLDKDPTAVWMASADLVRFGEFEDLIESAGRAVDRAEEARESYEEAADDLRRASLRGGDIADATKALDEAREEVRKALERLLEVMVLVDEATRAGRPPDPPEDAKGGGKKRKGPRLPWWACSGPNAAAADCKGRKWCPKCGPHEVCVACWWEMVPSSGAGGGKGKVLGREGASLGDAGRRMPQLTRLRTGEQPAAKYHSPDREGVRTPPDGAAAGIGPQSVGPFGGAPIAYYASPNESEADGAGPGQKPAVAPRDSAAPAAGGSTGGVAGPMCDCTAPAGGDASVARPEEPGAAAPPDSQGASTAGAPSGAGTPVAAPDSGIERSDADLRDARNEARSAIGDLWEENEREIQRLDDEIASGLDRSRSGEIDEAGVARLEQAVSEYRARLRVKTALHLAGSHVERAFEAALDSDGQRRESALGLIWQAGREVPRALRQFIRDGGSTNLAAAPDPAQPAKGVPGTEVAAVPGTAVADWKRREKIYREELARRRAEYKAIAEGAVPLPINPDYVELEPTATGVDAFLRVSPGTRVRLPRERIELGGRDGAATLWASAAEVESLSQRDPLSLGPLEAFFRLSRGETMADALAPPAIPESDAEFAAALREARERAAAGLEGLEQLRNPSEWVTARLRYVAVAMHDRPGLTEDVAKAEFEQAWSRAHDDVVLEGFVMFGAGIAGVTRSVMGAGRRVLGGRVAAGGAADGSGLVSAHGGAGLADDAVVVYRGMDAKEHARLVELAARGEPVTLESSAQFFKKEIVGDLGSELYHPFRGTDPSPWISTSKLSKVSETFMRQPDDVVVRLVLHRGDLTKSIALPHAEYLARGGAQVLEVPTIVSRGPLSFRQWVATRELASSGEVARWAVETTGFVAAEGAIVGTPVYLATEKVLEASRGEK